MCVGMEVKERERSVPSTGLPFICIASICGAFPDLVQSMLSRSFDVLQSVYETITYDQNNC